MGSLKCKMGLLKNWQRNSFKEIFKKKKVAKIEFLKKPLFIDEFLMEELNEKGSDKRFGVNLIARPSQNIIKAIKIVQQQLFQADPWQYYYPENTLHLTYFEILSGCKQDQVELTAKRIVPLAEQILQKVQVAKLGEPQIVCDPKSCSIFFIPEDEHLQKGRHHIHEQLKTHSIAITNRYFPVYAHVVFLRYVKPLAIDKKEWSELIESIKLKPILKWNIDRLFLTWGSTWYGLKENLDEEGPFLLNSNRSK